MESGSEIGKSSRAAATAALEAHVAVLKKTPLRLALSESLRKHPKLGGNERRFVAFATRELSRHQRYLDLGARIAGWPPSKLQLTEDQAIVRYVLWRRLITKTPSERIAFEVALPGPIRPRSIPDSVLKQILDAPIEIPLGDAPVERAATMHSFPNWLANAIAEAAPPGSIDLVLGALNREPYLTFRARPPGTRTELLDALAAAGVSVAASEGSANALHVSDDSRAIFETRYAKEGRLQVMDLGSQMLVDLCRAREGMSVVDYCAGAGGKTLALADAVGPVGRVYAHDSSAKRLKEAKERAGQLKLRHVSFPTKPRLDLADMVLVDAPCSGVGTLAREPDHKWSLTEEKVKAFAKTQRQILDEVASELKSGAVLVYATCSLLRAENEAVVDSFLRAHPDFEADGEALRVWPHQIAGGGFFGARLKKR